ncbi:MAG TPA: YjjG family noncanonical pyrimidine nucleotidase [Yeosuana sp.]
MKIKNITDVFFDLDHTLWDFDKNSSLTFHKIFELNKVEVNINEFLSFYEPINLDYWKLYREEKIDKASLRFGRLNDAFLAINKVIEREKIVKLSEDYITHLTSFNHLFENTIDVLEYLSVKYNLHIITNGFEEVQQKKLAQSNIDHYFKTVTNSEHVGVKKPNPLIFNYAIEVAKTNVKQSVMIGDNYEADILGAQNIGMNTIFFNINNHSHEHKIKQINNLNQLKTYL